MTDRAAAKINETTTFGQGEGDEDIIFDDVSEEEIDAVCVFSRRFFATDNYQL